MNTWVLNWHPQVPCDRLLSCDIVGFLMTVGDIVGFEVTSLNTWVWNWLPQVLNCGFCELVFNWLPHDSVLLELSLYFGNHMNTWVLNWHPQVSCDRLLSGDIVGFLMTVGDIVGFEVTFLHIVLSGGLNRKRKGSHRDEGARVDPDARRSSRCDLQLPQR